MELSYPLLSRPANPIPNPNPNPQQKLRRLTMEFRSLEAPIDRVRRLLDYAGALPPLPASERVAENRVAGCASEVWVSAGMDELGRMRFGADSDSEIARGFCGCLVEVMDGAWPEEVMGVRGEEIAEVDVVGAARGKGRSRVNVWMNVLVSMQRRTQEVVAERGSFKISQTL